MTVLHSAPATALFIFVGFPEKFWEMKFVDFANVMAQFATAGAFFLGFHQFRHSKRQAAQLVWAAECKEIILKIIDVLNDIKQGEQSDLRNLKEGVEKLGNLAIDFEEAFKALEEGDQKATIRMRWQKMYFNEFVGVMQGLSLQSLVEGSVKAESYLFAIGYARSSVNERNVLECYKEYYLAEEILRNLRTSLPGPLIPKVNMKFFVLFFFESEYVNDYMYGNMAHLDIKSRAPLLAAIYNSQS